DDPGSEPVEAILPSTAALSVDSPQSILQSAADGVPLGGQSPTDDALEVASVAIRHDRVVASLQAPVTCTAKVFVWGGESILAQTEKTMPARERTVSLPVKSLQQLLEDGADLHVAASFAADGKVTAATAHVDWWPGRCAGGAELQPDMPTPPGPGPTALGQVSFPNTLWRLKTLFTRHCSTPSLLLA